MRSLRDVAEELGLDQDHVELRGAHAKVSLASLATAPVRRGKYVLVTAITPNKAGIGAKASPPKRISQYNLVLFVICEQPAN